MPSNNCMEWDVFPLRASRYAPKTPLMQSVGPKGKPVEIVKFVAFLLVSHFVLMQIFRLTTYHAYFWKALPVLLAYSALVGYLLFAFALHKFFLWQVVLASAWLFSIGRKQRKAADAMLSFAGEDADTVRLMAMSTAKTSSYYTYSSFIYVLGFSLVYLVMYNQ